MNTVFSLSVRLLIAALVSVGAFSPQARAQAPTWPSKPVYLVMGYGPGSGADIEARLYGPHLSAALGVPVIVDGRPGAGGIIGAEYAAKQPPDGHTLFLSTAGITTWALLNKTLPFDPQKD